MAPLDPLPIFDADAPRELREQILRYHLAQTLTDVERARLLGLPATCRMREGAKIISPEKLDIGEHVWIGEGAVLDASGGLKIGSHTSIGLGVLIWTHSSHKLNRSMANVPGSDDIVRKPTSIGNGCFIAGPCVILAGTNVGDRAVIGPMSVVDRDLAPDEIYMPYKQTAKHIERLERRLEALAELVAKLQAAGSS